MNADILNTHICHKIVYDLEGYNRTLFAMEILWIFYTFISDFLQ